MAPPIQQQTGRYGHLTVPKFVFILFFALTTFQVINTSEYNNVHDEQAQDSKDALSPLKYSRDENIRFPEDNENNVDRYDRSNDFQNYDEHSLQQNNMQEKHIQEDKSEAQKHSGISGNIRYSSGSGKFGPRHNGQLFNIRAGQSPNEGGDILEFLGPCWLKAITTTAVISTSPVLVLLLIPIQNAETHKKLQKILLSFATGSFLGDAFFHMIPHAVMSSDHGDKELLAHGHSHTDESSHGQGFHSHDMAVGLCILSGIIVFLIADKFGQFRKYGCYNETDHGKVASDGNLSSIGNSSPANKSSTKRQDHTYAEKYNSTKRIENSSSEKNNSTKRTENSSSEKKNSTKRIENSLSEKKNSTKRIAITSREKKQSTKRGKNSSPEKINGMKRSDNCSQESKAKRVENSPSEKRIKAKRAENTSQEEPSGTKSVEDSSLRKRKGKGKHAHYKGKDRAGDSWADANKIERDIVTKVTNKSHSDAELYTKGEHRSQEKAVLSNNMKNTKAVSAALIPDIKVTGYLTLAADFAYNFTDGLAIGASFLAGGNIGTVTSLTIFIHELSHEIGDFAILVQSGYSKGKAVLLQFLTALGSLLGTVYSLTLRDTTRSTSWILPFTAGGFIYIALVSVIPDLLGKSRTWQSIKEILAVITGVVLMLLVALYE